MKEFIIRDDLIQKIQGMLRSYMKHANKCSYVNDEIEEKIEKTLQDFTTNLHLLEKIHFTKDELEIIRMLVDDYEIEHDCCQAFEKECDLCLSILSKLKEK